LTFLTLDIAVKIFFCQALHMLTKLMLGTVVYHLKKVACLRLQSLQSVNRGRAKTYYYNVIYHDFLLNLLKIYVFSSGLL
jgi:hypothetical protein